MWQRHFTVSHCLLERPVVLDKEHGDIRLFDKALYLFSQLNIYIVKRLVPDIKIRMITQAQRDQDTLLLPER